MQTLTQKSIKLIAGLSKPANRKETGLFIAEGFKVIDELLISGLRVEQLIIEKGREVPRHWTKASVPLFETSAAEMRKISSLTTPAGVLAIAARPVELDLPVPTAGTWILVMDGISDPGNAGTIIRTADWFGIKHLVTGAGSADCFAPKVVQSAMGSLFRVKIHSCDLPAYIKNVCVPSKYPVLAADALGTPVQSIDIPGGGVLVIGSESHGVSNEIMKLATKQVAITRGDHSIAESLNAAVACGILLNSLVQKQKAP